MWLPPSFNLRLCEGEILGLRAMDIKFQWLNLEFGIACMYICLLCATLDPSYLHCLGFPCGSAGKETIYNAGDLGSIPGLGRSPGEGKGSPLQYSGLENSMDCNSPWGRTESDMTERLD